MWGNYPHIPGADRRGVLRGIGGLLLATLVATAIAACSDAPSEPTATPTVAVAQSGGATSTAPTMRVAFATTDLAMGTNRLAFGVLDSESRPVRDPEVAASFVYLDVSPPEVRATATARFVKWPAGAAGVYVVDGVHLDQPGPWGIVVEVPTGDGDPQLAQAGFFVASVSASVVVGAPAPRSDHKTAADVADLSELTSSPTLDLDLYRVTIADAIATGRPTVVTFASPVFCQTAVCGPQVEVVSEIKERHKGRASFIHIEVYEDPHEIEGDISSAIPSPLMEEWGLKVEPFTFVLDGEGIVRAKFESFVTAEELEAALGPVLGP